MENLRLISETELRSCCEYPKEIANNPYLLFVAYTLNALIDSNTEEDGPDLWSLWSPEKPTRSIIENSIEDFLAAIESRNQLKFTTGGISVRNADNVKREELEAIFQFPVNKYNFMEFKKDAIYLPDKCIDAKTEFKENRQIAARIMYVGKTDDGYDSLSDIETAVYTWIIWYKKHKDVPQHWVAFWNKYKKSLDYLTVKDIQSVLADKYKSMDNMNSYFVFSAEKINAWNIRNKQKHTCNDAIETIQQQKADDFWFDNFK